MSGETARQESGWTVDTLKELHDRDFDHFRELRKADQKALDLALQNNKERLDHLNENAKRTIEERSHFVAKEAFEPFRDNVNKKLANDEGSDKGVTNTIAYIVTAISLAFGVAGMILAFNN